MRSLFFSSRFSLRPWLAFGASFFLCAALRAQTLADLSASALSGKTFDFKITGGNSPFESTGSFSILFEASGQYSIAVSSGSATAHSGSYIYASGTSGEGPHLTLNNYFSTGTAAGLDLLYNGSPTANALTPGNAYFEMSAPGANKHGTFTFGASGGGGTGGGGSGGSGTPPQVLFVSFAFTWNETSLALALDRAIAAGNINALRDALNALLTPAQARQALVLLSPQHFTRWFNISLGNADALAFRIGQHLAQGDVAVKTGAAWAEVVHRRADFDDGIGFAGAVQKVDGIVTGYDFPGLAGLDIGFLFAYEDAAFDFGGNGGRTKTKSYQPAVYARRGFGAWKIQATLGYAWHDYASTRLVAIPGYVQTAHSDTRGSTRFVNVGTGYDFKFGDLIFAPFVAVQHTRWSADGFTETGAALAALTVADQFGESLATRTGAGFGQTFLLGGVSVTPRIEGTWRHEFDQRRRQLNAQIGGAAFVTQSQRAAADGWVGAFSLEVRLAANFNLYARATREQDGSASTSMDYSAGATYRF